MAAVTARAVGSQRAARLTTSLGAEDTSKEKRRCTLDAESVRALRYYAVRPAYQPVFLVAQYAFALFQEGLYRERVRPFKKVRFSA